MSIIERIDPVAHRKDLMYPEHLGRYIFAGQFVRDKRVLDIACGNGYGSHYLSVQGQAGQVYGVDIAAEAIKYSQAHYRRDNLKFIQSDACRITPIPDQSVDIAVSFETIEHVLDYQSFLLEINRVLTPEGILIISCPNDFIFNPDNPYHVHKFNFTEFQSLLTARFSQVQFYAQNNLLGTGIMPKRMVEEAKDAPIPQTGQLLGVDRKELTRADTWLAVCANRELSQPQPVVAFLSEYSDYVKEITRANENLFEENQRLSEAWTQHVHTINVHTDYIKRIEAENRRLQAELAKKESPRVPTLPSETAPETAGPVQKFLNRLKYSGK